jgi:hypothetical protein
MSFFCGSGCERSESDEEIPSFALKNKINFSKV